MFWWNWFYIDGHIYMLGINENKNKKETKTNQHHHIKSLDYDIMIIWKINHVRLLI